LFSSPLGDIFIYTPSLLDIEFAKFILLFAVQIDFPIKLYHNRY